MTSKLDVIWGMSVESIIKHFTKASIPICIHDSFVINPAHTNDLNGMEGLRVAGSFLLRGCPLTDPIPVFWVTARTFRMNLFDAMRVMTFCTITRWAILA